MTLRNKKTAAMMDNIEVEVRDDGKLVLTIDLNRTGRDSRSGKSVLIASSGGNVEVPVPNDWPVHVGVNCFRYKDERVKDRQRDDFDKRVI